MRALVLLALCVVAGVLAEDEGVGEEQAVGDDGTYVLSPRPLFHYSFSYPAPYPFHPYFYPRPYNYYAFHPFAVKPVPTEDGNAVDEPEADEGSRKKREAEAEPEADAE